jgi:hypothetical protein
MQHGDLREIISSQHALSGSARPGRAERALLADTTALVRAPQDVVAGVYADFENWPRLFPTISAVRLVGRDGPRLAVEVDHVQGRVANELILRCPDEIELWEIKRHYDACFRNRFVAVADGTLFTVIAEVWLKGWARLLRPFLRRYVRRQMQRFQLHPVQAMAEAQARRTALSSVIGAEVGGRGHACLAAERRDESAG